MPLWTAKIVRLTTENQTVANIIELIKSTAQTMFSANQEVFVQKNIAKTKVVVRGDDELLSH